MITLKEIKERFAKINGMSAEEVDKTLNNAETADDALAAIKSYTTEKLREKYPLNRKQRRALAKRKGKSKVDEIRENVEKINYINLIEKLRELNEKKEKENEKTNQDE